MARLKEPLDRTRNFFGLDVLWYRRLVVVELRSCVAVGAQDMAHLVTKTVDE